MNKYLNFGGDPEYRLDTGIVFRIRHYWEIPKVVNGLLLKTGSPDGGTDIATLVRRAWRRYALSQCL